MNIMETLATIPGLGPIVPWLVIALAVAGAAAQLVAPYMPPPSSPYGAYAAIYGVVNTMAGNRGEARNANNPEGTKR